MPFAPFVTASSPRRHRRDHGGKRRLSPFLRTNLVSGTALAAGILTRDRRARPDASALPLMIIIMGLLCGFVPGTPLPAQDNPETADQPDRTAVDAPELLTRVGQLDADVATVKRQGESLQDEISEARKRATDLDRQWRSLVGQMDQIQAEQQQLKSQLKTDRESEREVAAKQKTSREAVETAREQLQLAQQRLSEAEKQLGEANEEAASIATTRAETETQLSSLKPPLAPLRVAAEKAEKASRKLHHTIDGMEADALKFDQQRRSIEQQIETLLRDSNEWISFTDQIAPIFHQRCVACHNARNAQGRYNMATYAAILSEGESGTPIEPGDAESSLLVQAVEEGWMPHDSDPLDEDQIERIRRWVELGARLDSSVDPGMALIRLMPRVIQPDPPQHYRVPIPVTAVAIDTSGQWLASSGYHEVLLWSLPSGELASRITNVAERVYGLAFHPDGRRLAVASGTPGRIGEVKIFDRQSGQLMEDRLISEDVMFEVAFSPDGSLLAACGADGTIAILDVDDLAARPRLIDDHADWVNGISWSPDGKSLVSASRDKTAKVFDAESGRLKMTFGGHQQNVTSAMFASDGERVISGGDDRKLRVWKVADGKQEREIKDLGGEISGLLRLDGDDILSIGTDNKIHLHRSTDGKPWKEWTVPSDWPSSVTMTTDQQVLVIGDQAGDLHRIHLQGDGAGEVERSWAAAP